MSWSIEEHIGACRPFPAQVVVYKGETDECLAYVSGEVADRLKAENAELRKLLLSVWNDACQFDDFWDYVYDDGTLYREDELPHYQDRMRELGIEVE